MASTQLSIEPKPVPTRSQSELSSDTGVDDEKLSTASPSVVNGTTTDVEAAAGNGKLARLTQYLAGIGIETRSLERVQEDQREQVRRAQSTTGWLNLRVLKLSPARYANSCRCGAWR
jgi:hypothetical protein